MLNFTELLVITGLMLLGFIFGYLTAHKKFDGRPQNMPESFKVLQGIKLADRLLMASLVAYLIVYISRDYL